MATAWELARQNGLAGLSLRDLARRLGMAAPSLYSYVDSKHALYDEMFADGYRAALARPEPEPGADLRSTLHRQLSDWMAFALEDPVRAQLLNQRTIPGFEPSPASYALAQEAYARSFAALDAVLDLRQDDRDLVTAVAAGLLAQQLANDPGGTRWVRLIDDVVDLLLPRLETRIKTPVPPEDRTGEEPGP